MKFVKNLNRRAGMPIYVAFRGDVWIAKIFYQGHLTNYLIDFEDNIIYEEIKEVQ